MQIFYIKCHIIKNKHAKNENMTKNQKNNQKLKHSLHDLVIEIKENVGKYFLNK